MGVVVTTSASASAKQWRKEQVPERNDDKTIGHHPLYHTPPLNRPLLILILILLRLLRLLRRRCRLSRWMGEMEEEWVVRQWQESANPLLVIPLRAFLPTTLRNPVLPFAPPVPVSYGITVKIVKKSTESMARTKTSRQPPPPPPPPPPPLARRQTSTYRRRICEYGHTRRLVRPLCRTTTPWRVRR